MTILMFLYIGLEIISVGAIISNLCIFALVSDDVDRYFPTIAAKIIFVVVAEVRDRKKEIERTFIHSIQFL
jgi:hypothetical protein